MSSFSKSDNIDITPQNRLSVNSLSPTPNTSNIFNIATSFLG